MLDVSLRKKIDNFQLDVTFRAKEGVTGIFGRSGSGKSLTLQCLAGLLLPDEGSIVLHGKTLFSKDKKVHIKPQHRNVGYVFQHYALFPHMTIKENIEFGISQLPKTVRNEKVASFIEKMHLLGLEEKYPAQLSGGQQQRTALARTLITDPSLLLLDEPFAALDNLLRQELSEQLLSLIDEHFKGIVLLITHDLDEAYRLCDELLMYDKGRIVQAGKTSHIFAAPETESVAQLLGYRNIFPVSHSRKINNETKIIQAGDLQLHCYSEKQGNYACFHSHQLHVAAHMNDGRNVFPCELRSYRKGLYNTTLFLRYKQTPIIAEIDNTTASSLLKMKEQLFVHIPPADVLLIK